MSFWMKSQLLAGKIYFIQKYITYSIYFFDITFYGHFHDILMISAHLLHEYARFKIYAGDDF